MSESAHARFDRHERELLDAAAEDLWADALLDGVIDVAPSVIDALAWRRAPEGASQGWTNRSHAILGLSAMSLRATRTVALLIRCGYGPEGFGNLRRVIEASGHAVNVANDESGEYAANWLARRGRAGSPRRAVGQGPESDDMWRITSGLMHANFADFTNLSAEIDDDGRLIHRASPGRAPTLDNAVLWLAGRYLGRTLAAVLTVRPETPQNEFLQAAAPLIAEEDRLSAELQTLAQERARRGSSWLAR